MPNSYFLGLAPSDTPSDLEKLLATSKSFIAQVKELDVTEIQKESIDPHIEVREEAMSRLSDKDSIGQRASRALQNDLQELQKIKAKASARVSHSIVDDLLEKDPFLGAELDEVLPTLTPEEEDEESAHEGSNIVFLASDTEQENLDNDLLDDVICENDSDEDHDNDDDDTQEHESDEEFSEEESFDFDEDNEPEETLEDDEELTASPAIPDDTESDSDPDSEPEDEETEEFESSDEDDSDLDQEDEDNEDLEEDEFNKDDEDPEEDETASLEDVADEAESAEIAAMQSEDQENLDFESTAFIQATAEEVLKADDALETDSVTDWRNQSHTSSARLFQFFSPVVVTTKVADVAPAEKLHPEFRI